MYESFNYPVQIPLAHHIHYANGAVTAKDKRSSQRDKWKVNTWAPALVGYVLRTLDNVADLLVLRIGTLNAAKTLRASQKSMSGSRRRNPKLKLFHYRNHDYFIYLMK